ncbi:MAG: sodium-dependent transporter [Bacteroidales bacterium]|nr:sodium-dependent transporter [Bacteroidales bacterium]
MDKKVDQSVHQRFSTRFALLLSALGIAVGTGNIWRFPRIAAQNGGDNGAGALIIAWLIFLFIWSIPLIITEYVLGRKFRYGVIGNFIKGAGKRFAWMGGFVAVVATGIALFYAVIVGWAMYFLFYFILNPLPESAGASADIWNVFQQSNIPFMVHALAVLLGGLAIWKGIRSIEKVNSVLIPALIAIILFAVIKAIFLPGAMAGISYLFRPEWRQFLQPEIWLQALTQNAWDTGAGWGLFLTYAAYMKTEHGVVKNAFITGIGNNTISILMAIVIFSTVFSVLQFNAGYSDARVLEVMKTSGPASTGLTFMWLPQLFAKMQLGRFLAIIFFLGLTFAGFSSLISMFELTTRIFVDMGFKRTSVIPFMLIFIYLGGFPSAVNLDFLSNQDYVWGIGLIVSGIFIAVFASRCGINNLRNEFDSSGNDWIPGRWWDFIIRFFIPLASILLILWWLFLSATVMAPDKWYHPFNPFSVMTCLFQWTIVLLILMILNKWMVRRTVGSG